MRVIECSEVALIAGMCGIITHSSIIGVLTLMVVAVITYTIIEIGIHFVKLIRKI